MKPVGSKGEKHFRLDANAPAAAELNIEAPGRGSGLAATENY